MRQCPTTWVYLPHTHMSFFDNLSTASSVSHHYCTLTLHTHTQTDLRHFFLTVNTDSHIVTHVQTISTGQWQWQTDRLTTASGCCGRHRRNSSSSSSRGTAHTHIASHICCTLSCLIAVCHRRSSSSSVGGGSSRRSNRGSISLSDASVTFCLQHQTTTITLCLPFFYSLNSALLLATLLLAHCPHCLLSCRWTPESDTLFRLFHFRSGVHCFGGSFIIDVSHTSKWTTHQFFLHINRPWIFKS